MTQVLLLLLALAAVPSNQLQKRQAPYYQKPSPQAYYKKPAPPPQASYYQPQPQPAYQPAPQPAYYQPAPAPAYYQPAPAAPAYYQPAPAPAYYQPAAPAAPAYYQPQPQPAYQPAPQPAYYQPAPAPAYYQPAPAPAYYQPAPAAPAYYQPAAPAAPAYYQPQAAYSPKPKKPKGQDLSKVPGQAGVDYPIYHEVPDTKFSCASVPAHPGIYANVDTGCQAYHVCHDGREGHQGASFLCPNGTLFNQHEFACDWWYNVNCKEAPQLYSLNLDPLKNPYAPKPKKEEEAAVAAPEYYHP